VKVTILRGIPGCGKSTYAQKLMSERLNNCDIVSADDFFMVNGVYRFDPSRLPTAHLECYKRFCYGLTKERDVIVDNTNTTAWEVAAYYQFAIAAGATVEVVRFYYDPVLAHARNIHGVPFKQVLTMHQKLLTEQLPPWVNETVLLSS
jgi:predicted kinase